MKEESKEGRGLITHFITFLRTNKEVTPLHFFLEGRPVVPPAAWSLFSDPAVIKLYNLKGYLSIKICLTAAVFKT